MAYLAITAPEATVDMEEAAEMALPMHGILPAKVLQEAAAKVDRPEVTQVAHLTGKAAAKALKSTVPPVPNKHINNEGGV